MWKGRGWSPVSNHGSTWWSGKGNGKGWRRLAFEWLSLHEYSIGLIPVLLEIKVIFIPKVTIFPYCLGEMANTCFSPVHRVCYNVPRQNKIADTGCLQESKWNQKCQSCVPNTWHQITGGSPSSPMLSVQSWSSLLVNRRWHGREYFPIETNFFWFYFFFGGNQVLQGFVLTSLSLAILRGAGKKCLYTRHKSFTYTDTHRCMLCK